MIQPFFGRDPYDPLMADEQAATAERSAAVPSVIGAQPTPAVAAPSAEATVKSPVIGEYDKLVNPVENEKARKAKIADITAYGGESSFDPDTLAAARRALAGGLTPSDESDDVLVKDPKTGRLVSTKPKWYSGNTAPAQPNTALNAIGVGLNAIGAGKQQLANNLAQDSNRHAGNKMLDQQRATSAGLLGGLASFFANNEAKQQDRNLDYALKEAQMYRTLNPSKAGATNQVQTNAANILRLDRDQRNQYLAGEREGRFGINDAAKKQELIDRNSTDSAISQRAQNAIVSLGMVSPQAAQAMSSEDIKKLSSQMSQKDQQRFQLAMKSMDILNDTQKRADTLEEQQSVDYARIQNERSQKLADAAINGGQWNRQPTDKDRTDVLGILRARENLVRGSQTIAQLRDEAAKRYGGLEKMVQYFSNKTGASLTPEDAYLQRRIQGAQMLMSAAHSELFNYGVPSTVELKRTGSLTGEQGINALLFPTEFYKAAADEANETLTPQLNNRGFWLNGQQAPAMQEPEHFTVRSEQHAPIVPEEVRNLVNPPSAPQGAAPAPVAPQQSPFPAPMQTGAPPQANSRGEVMPAVPASQPADNLGTAPMPRQPTFTPPAPIRQAPARAAAPAQAAAPAAPTELHGTITVKGKTVPWAGSQADLDAIMKEDPSAKFEAKK